MTITGIVTNQLIEESVYISAVVAEITTSEPAVLSITAGDPNGYLQIEQTGIVYLTSAGVLAINADNQSDTSTELTRLDFTVSAVSTRDGSSVQEEVHVGIIRIHDEVPYITNSLLTPLYFDDISTGMKLLELRTKYSAQMTILNGTNMVFVDSSNTGVYLSQDGFNFIKSIQSFTETLDFTILLIDDINSKETQVVYSLDILQGSAGTRIPTKSILDLVGEYVGKSNANDYSELKDLLYKVNFEFNKTNADYYVTKYGHIDSVHKIESLDNILTELNTTVDNKIGSVKELVYNLVTSLKTEIGPNIIKEIVQNMERVNTIYFRINEKTQDIEVMTNENRTEILSLKDFLIRYIDTRDDYFEQIDVNARTLLNQQLTVKINTLTNQLNNFINVIYQAYITQNATVLNNHATSISNHTNRIEVLEGEMDVVQSDITSIKSNLTSIPNNTLITYPIPNSYSFTNFSLLYAGSHVLTATASNVNIGPGGNTISITTGWFGNSSMEVRGSYFTGTAARATYADVAEFYKVKEEIQRGTIVSFSTSAEYEIMPADGVHIPIGFITTDPAYTMNQPAVDSPYLWSAIALIGRIPVLVVNANEAKRGDIVYQDKNNPQRGFCSSILDPSRQILGRVINVIDGYWVEIKVQNI